MCQIKNKGGKKFTGQDIMPISRVSLLTKGKGDFVIFGYISFSEIMDSHELLVDIVKADVSCTYHGLNTLLLFEPQFDSLGSILNDLQTGERSDEYCHNSFGEKYACLG